MKKLGRFLFKMGKGIYDIFATYLLLWVLYITVVSLGLHAGFALLAQALEIESVELMWLLLSRRLGGLDPLWIRLVIYGALQLGIYMLLRGPLDFLLSIGERVFNVFQRAHLKLEDRLPRVHHAISALFTLGVTILLIPFVLQPTLVPMRFGPHAVAERAANLADGEATLGFADSVVGFYRRIWAKPNPIEGLPADQIDDAFAKGEDGDIGPLPKATGNQPMMDRWDPYIWKVAGEDAEQFAFIKAFMWVESAGRQFAVSHTGCMGLMQFCSGTATSEPFGAVFGTGQVYRCACDGPCRVDRQIQRDMERGDATLIDKHKKDFPCEVTDARFNGPKAITAGSLYIDQLRNSYDDNIYLMYIGYNSGPAVANRLWRTLDRNPAASLEEIEVHLAATLERWYGDQAASRARGLVGTHLPKIKRTYQRYLEDAQQPRGVALRCLPEADSPRPAPMMPVDMPAELAARIEALEASHTL